MIALLFVVAGLGIDLFLFIAHSSASRIGVALRLPLARSLAVAVRFQARRVPDGHRRDALSTSR